MEPSKSPNCEGFEKLTLPQTRMHNNEGSILRPFYYFFAADDARGLFRMKLNFNLHNLNQSKSISFTKQTRGYSYEYLLLEHIISLLRIAMFEFLGRRVLNVGTIVSKNRERIRSTDIVLGKLDEKGPVYYQGKMYDSQRFKVNSKPYLKDTSWMSDCQPKVHIEKALPKTVDALAFCEYIKETLLDNDENAVTAINYPIMRIIQMTNDALSTYHIIRKFDGVKEAIEYAYNKLTPTLYDFELTISILQWKPQKHCHK